MDSTEKQLADMLNELKSRSIVAVILESSFFNISFVVLDGWQLNNPPRYVAKPSDKDNSKYVRGITRRYRLMFGRFRVGSFGTCCISDISVAVQRFNVPNPRVHSHSLSCCISSHIGRYRYFRIVKPSKYRRYFTKKKTMIMILLSWFYSMCCPLPYFLGGHKMIFHASKFFCYPPIDNSAFVAFWLLLYQGIPSTIILYCYLRVFQTVRSHSINFQRPGNPVITANVEEIKVARTLFVTVMIFSLCWIPIIFIDIVDTIQGRWSFPREAYLTYTYLALISSAINPLIYGVLNKNSRKEYHKLFYRRCRRSYRQAVVQPLALTATTPHEHVNRN